MEELIIKKDLYCVICGSLKENHYYSLCRDCTPFLYKKQSLPHQKARRRKKWLKKRAIVIENVGNKCQWCDSEKPPFSIHHPVEVNARTYDRIWSTLITDRVNKLIENDSTLRELLELRVRLEAKKIVKRQLKNLESKANHSLVDACPYCLSTQIKERTTKTPRYKCTACKKEFETLIKRAPRNLTRNLENLETRLKTQNYSYTRPPPYKILGPLFPFIYNEVRQAYDEAVLQLVSSYEEMKDVSVLCKKCHSAARLGLVICEKCKTNYRKTQYEVCFHCYKKEKGITKKEKTVDYWDFSDFDDDDDWEELDYNEKDDNF